MTEHLTVKLDRKMKESFFNLCQEEGIDVSQGTRELIIEALSRGYIIKERKERLQKVRGS